MVGGRERRRVAAHQVAGDPELLVGVLVGAADVALADRGSVRRSASGALDVVELRIDVEARVRVAVGIGLRDECHELMRDLVGERVSDHREIGVGLELPEDEVDHGEAVGPLEIAALLDVGVLVDDAGFLRCEVRRCPRWQVVCDVLLEPVLARASGRQAGARRPALCDGARERRVVQLELGRVGRERDQLDVVTDRLSDPRPDEPVHALQLDRLEVADLEVDRRAGARLPDRAHDGVVVLHTAAVLAVVEVDVVRAIRILSGEGGVDRPRRLLRRGRRVARRHAGPAGGGGERRCDLIGDAEECRARLLDRVRSADQHAAVREERGEVDCRTVDVRGCAADPVDLRNLLAGTFGGVRDRVGLENACARERRPVRERVARAVEGVVRRAVLRRVRAGGHRVPADARVGREGLEHAVLAGRSSVHQFLVRRHVARLGVLLHQVRPHPVGGEEDDLLDRPHLVVSPGAGRTSTERRDHDHCCHTYQRGQSPADTPCHVALPLLTPS